MRILDSNLLEQIRDEYREHATPSDLLRRIIQLHAEPCHKLDLIANIRATFALSLNEASPIGGWAADGSGELNDEKLDRFLSEAIDQHRTGWDSKLANQ